jgi:tight adherence protein C
MSTISALIAANAGYLVGLLVFVASTSIAFLVMTTARNRASVRRRAAGISADPFEAAGSSTLAGSGKKMAQRLIERTTKHYASIDDKNLKLLRQRLVQAGIFEPKAVGFFFLARAALAVVLGAAAFLAFPALATVDSATQWAVAGVGGLFGYLGPSLVLDRIIKIRRLEYRAGFPDFMDLLVVCADAGLGIAGALERVGRELAGTYPYLSANIHMTNLEIRAGRTISEALEHFGDRLGLDEVRAFATLIQQSDELGSSITEALRVYSEDMRHKRLSLAEEKAYALPSKLALPLMACVFPVLFVVILLPVFVRMKMGAY